LLNEPLLDEFRRHHDDLDAQRAALQTAVSDLLGRRDFAIHLVSGRLKSETSLRKKLSRPDRTYARLWDITDLVGLRITTYFEDRIEHVARAIEQAFPVDFDHSADKLSVKDHQRFGYRSLHYVCRLPDATETGLPPEFRFEIQLRTVLQHAWAEVEHDLGYKSPDVVPDALRRRFTRVAGLLEIADEEFVAVRREIERYTRAAEDALADPEQPFPLDLISLHSVARSAEVRALDERIAAQLGRPLATDVFFPDYLVRMLRRSGLATTTDLYRSLRENREHVAAMVQPYFEFTSRTWKLTAASVAEVHRGYCLFFLSHVEILRGPELGISKVSKLTQLYRELDYPDDERAAQRVASGLVAALGTTA